MSTIRPFTYGSVTPIKMNEYNERIDLDESTIDISSLTELIENADIEDITDETSWGK